MARGIHVRYTGEGVRAVPGVGLFQHGTIGFAPGDLAIELLRSGEFETVSRSPTAQAFIVRVEQLPEPTGPRSPDLPTEAADFERELEEAEQQYEASVAKE